MLVVSNTSPLLNLAIIEHLFLVREQFAEIIIPTEVKKELRINENLPGSQILKEAIETDWIKVRSLKAADFMQVLRRDLDKGEAEAIALAVELKSDWLLLDEKEGRRIARLLGLKVTGILGIILRGWYEGKVSSVKEVIEQLRTQAHFHIAPSLETQILKETGELEK